MTGIVTAVGLVLAGVVVVLTAFRALRDRPVERPELAVAGLLELAVLVYVVVRVVDLVRGHHVDSPVVLVVYLVALVLVVPVAVALAVAERTRWGAVTLGVGALVVAVLLARVHQLWTTRG